MNDLALVQKSGVGCLDLLVEAGDLKEENGFETAVLVSLYTDAFVKAEELPPGIFETRGWWADELSVAQGDKIGSKIWTLRRETITFETRNKLKRYVEEALQWLIDDGAAQRIEVTSVIVNAVSGKRIDFDVKIIKPDGEDHIYKFIWDAQALKGRG